MISRCYLASKFYNMTNIDNNIVDNNILDKTLEELAVTTVKGLAMDAPFRANSGHSGTAMALAPLAQVLFSRIMKYDADDPKWFDRDRFILSCGHASILIYSMLFLTGISLTLEDLKSFRTYNSLTPGHPEVHHTLGIEVTTGPLGQGFGNAVGMAIAEQYLEQKFSSEIIDHYTYVICSDGDFMEGISHEAGSLAGHLGLKKLIAIYDDNHITIDGNTEIAYSDDVAMRFEAYGWNVVKLGEIAENLDLLETAILQVKKESDRPNLLILRSHIGFPSPDLTDTSKAHGDPFPEDEIKKTKELLGLDPNKSFQVPDEVKKYMEARGRRSAQIRSNWETKVSQLKDNQKKLFDSHMKLSPLTELNSISLSFEPGAKIATRKAIQACMDEFSDNLPFLLAGSADLTGNTGMKLKNGSLLSKANRSGNQIAFGIREHIMGSSMNGMALHGGILPIGGTFFIFSDYMRPAVRLAALSNAHTIFTFTHDSIGLGEDGPTHQPIEQLASLRAIPNLKVIRPADANETVQAFKIAIQSDGPTALIASRQAITVLKETEELAQFLKKGAYILKNSETPKIILIATGSEVALAVDAARELDKLGISPRVVSMPSWDLFEKQPEDYKRSVLSDSIPKLSIEAGASLGWNRYSDMHIGLDRFGASAPGDVNFRELGFTVENIVNKAQILINTLA